MPKTWMYHHQSLSVCCWILVLSYLLTACQFSNPFESQSTTTTTDPNNTACPGQFPTSTPTHDKALFAMMYKGGDNLPEIPTTIASYDTENGKTLWEKTIEHATFAQTSTLTVYQGIVYFTHSSNKDIPYYHQRNNSSSITALNAQNGDLIWKKNNDHKSSIVKFIVCHEILYLHFLPIKETADYFKQQKIVALSTKDGKFLWEISYSNAIRSIMATQEFLYITTNNHCDSITRIDCVYLSTVHALSRTGEEVWRSQEYQSSCSAVNAYAYGPIVYFIYCLPEKDADIPSGPLMLDALQTDSNSVLWSKTLLTAKESLYISRVDILAIHKNIIYTSYSHGGMNVSYKAIDISTKDLIWEQNYSSKLQAINIDDESIYTYDKNRVDLTFCTMQGRENTPNWCLPILDPGGGPNQPSINIHSILTNTKTVFIWGSARQWENKLQRNELYAVDRTNGKILWQRLFAPDGRTFAMDLSFDYT